MPPTSLAAKDKMLDALDIVSLSLHSGLDSNGALEINGGTPAYARQPVTWLPTYLGLKVIAAPVVFNVPACTVGWVGYWSSDDPAQFLGMSPLGGSVVLPIVVDGPPTSNVQCVRHALGPGASVVAWNGVPPSFLPGDGDANLVEGQQYFVTSLVSADALQLGLVQSGDPIVFTQSGSGYIQQFAPTTFVTQDQYTISAFALDARVL